MNNLFTIKVLKNFTEVKAHLTTVQSFADKNKLALGFLPSSAFHEQAFRERLWVAIREENDEFLGYLLFGGRSPSIKIFQLFVCPENRKQGVASYFVKQLVDFGEDNNYLSISAKVAADLPANRFWEIMGFKLVRQESGGKTLRRKINLRIKDLETPSLLKMMNFVPNAPSTTVKDLCFSPRPITKSSIYVLDLNIFFDVLRDRVHRKEASLLIKAGLNNQIRVCVTPEFTEELRKHTKAGQPDPVLEFAKEIPTLPKIKHTELDCLLSELKALIFPLRSPTGKQADRSQSDLMHLAYCIHHRMTGFVTREKAILATSRQLEQSYSLETLSPVDLFQASESPETTAISLRASYGQKTLFVATVSEQEREEVERFLVAIGVHKDILPAVWDPGASGSIRRRIIVRSGEKLIGVASWDSSSPFINHIHFHLYIDEQNPEAERVIDHIFETVLRDSEPFESRIVELQTSLEQTQTRATALQRGFVRAFPLADKEQETSLSKFTFRGVVTRKNWSHFSDDFEKLTGLRLPQTVPTLNESQNTGIPISNPAGRLIVILKLFDFETLVSPAIVLCSGRSSLIVPIRERFAKDLFNKVDPQMRLFPSLEAILHVEKAYFRYPRKIKLFESGIPVFFYLSGSGGGTKEIIGCARITYSEKIAADKLGFSLRRQGVLSYDELLELSDKSKNIHVFTFDNFNPFPNRIPFSFLRDNQLISKANLVTVEPLSAEHTLRICNCGFGLEKVK